MLNGVDPRRLSPSLSKVFNAFTTDPTEFKLCICLQDPYPSKRHATGWAMDVNEGQTRQTLYIFQQAGKEYGININSLDPIKQDVFLLNTNLTTQAGVIKAHDWRWFTRQVVEHLQDINPDCGFAFLGKYAQDINTVNGLNFYHPVANARTGKQLFNKSFFEQTSQYLNWYDYY